MKRVELIKGRDYRGHGVKASKGEPFAVEDDKAKELVDTGFFKSEDILSSDNGAEDSDADNGEEEKDSDDNSKDDETEKPIEKMKKEELIALAAEKEIDISSCTNNDERIAIIKAVIASDNGAEADFGE